MTPIAAKELETYTTTVISNKSVTAPTQSKEEIRELVLEIDAADFPCEVGQTIGISAPLPAGSRETSHRRLYSIADLPAHHGSPKPRITLIIHRCVTTDSINGEVVRGIASNYLCDLKEGATLDITGPHGLPFQIPPEKDATLILIGTGTGIAPFRAFVKHLHRRESDWNGIVRIFYGTRNGLDILYGNDPHEDVMQYFDQETFDALSALCPHPNWADPIAWDHAFSERGEELLDLMRKRNTYVYVAGLESIRDQLDTLFSSLLGSSEQWAALKNGLAAEERWVELLY